MKLGDAGRSLVGAVVIYVVMAACSGGGGHAGGGAGGAAVADGAAGFGGSFADAEPSQRDATLVDKLTNPVADARADAVSGSRLKARYLVTPDGAKQFIGWHDAERNENCAFEFAADGQQHCLPVWVVPDGIFAGGPHFGSYSADAGCSQPLAHVGVGCPGVPPKYAALSVSMACSAEGLDVRGAVQLFAMGPQVQQAAIYIGSPGSCSLYTNAPPGDYYLVQLDKEIPPSSFVAATVVTDP
jgi:hypothetical protein